MMHRMIEVMDDLVDKARIVGYYEACQVYAHGNTSWEGRARRKMYDARLELETGIRNLLADVERLKTKHNQLVDIIKEQV